MGTMKFLSDSSAFSQATLLIHVFLLFTRAIQGAERPTASQSVVTHFESNFSLKMIPLIYE